MTYEAELKARLEELEALAEHVPPGVLAGRLVAGISEHMERNHLPIAVRNLSEKFADWQILAVIPEPNEPVGEEAPPLEEEPVSTKPGFPADPPEEEMLAVVEFEPESEPEPVEEEESGEEPEGKTCMKCGETKGFSEFDTHHMSKDGYRKLCNSCAARGIGRPISTPLANGEGEKPCTACGETKPLSEFAKSTGSKDGRRTECKACHNQRRRAEPKSERLCANGEKCVGYKHMKRPTKLNSGNGGKFCFACEERGRGDATRPISAAIPGIRGRG